MIEFALLGAIWLLLSLPVSVLLGKCIAVGQAGEDARHAEPGAGGTAAADWSVAAQASEESASPTVPAQRQPAVREPQVR